MEAISDQSTNLCYKVNQLEAICSTFMLHNMPLESLKIAATTYSFKRDICFNSNFY